MTTLLVLRAGIRSGEAAIHALCGVVAVASAAFLIISMVRSMQLGNAKVTAPAYWMMATVAIALGLAALTTVAAFWLAPN